MPDPTGSPRPYQERFLAALEGSGRLETPSEHWIRERIESRRAFLDNALFAAFLAEIAQREINEAYKSAPPKWLSWTRCTGPTIGRKRRARRARGRRRHA